MMDPLLTLTCIKLRREGGDLWEANYSRIKLTDIHQRHGSFLGEKGVTCGRLIIHELNSLIFTRGMDHSLQLSHQCDHTCKVARAPAPERLPDFLNVPHY